MHSAWFFWSVYFLIVWAVIFLFGVNKPWQKQMLRVSLWTMPFGLTEPLFVPEYWNPPTLFDLAQTTGFDIESLIFTFAIGGIASVLYQAFFHVRLEPVPMDERMMSRHKLHRYLLFTPIPLFVLLATLTPLNHIYCGIIAMFVGSLATLICRPDLKGKIWVGGLIFAFFYFIFFQSFSIRYAHIVDMHWNNEAISGIRILDVPLEEVLFGFTFGMYWSSIYEHLLWYRMNRIASVGDMNVA